MENAKCRNETSHLERAFQITNNKLNAIANDANARKQDLMALFQKVQSTEQRLENSTRSLEARQNMTFLKLQKDKINSGRLNIFGLINIVLHSISKVKVKSPKKIGLKFSCPKGLKYIHSSIQIEIHVYGLLKMN
jgi:predicted nuclease with TOPRIM domain